MAVPHSRYTAVPARAMNIPTTHIIKDRPTLPDNCRIVLGVAKIPVPIMRLKMSNEALNTPSCRRSSGEASKTLPSSIEYIRRDALTDLPSWICYLHNWETPSALRGAPSGSFKETLTVFFWSSDAKGSSFMSLCDMVGNRNA